MTAFESFTGLDRDALHDAVRQSCAKIAPTWPLDRMIAVNPLWERREQAWHSVAEQLWQRAGISLTLKSDDYRRAWHDGVIAERHLLQAQTEQGGSLSVEQLLRALDESPADLNGLPLQEDMADPSIALPGWPVLINQQIQVILILFANRFQHIHIGISSFAIASSKKVFS